MKPLLIYDGECGFCRRWVLRWQSFTRDLVDYAPYQEVARRYPQIPLEKFKESVQLILPDGEVLSGAKAVFRTLACAPERSWMFWLYEHLPGLDPVCEGFYRLVARNRIFFSHLTQFLWGSNLNPPSYKSAREIFLKCLGLIYFIAFVSFAVQAKGLVGEKGILPVQDFLGRVTQQAGWERYWFAPTLCWLSPTDGFIQFLSWGGASLALLLVLDFAPALMLFLLWSFYLSLVTIGQDFMGFQWDNLLLEAGFLAIFLVPLRILPRKEGDPPPSKIFLWLLRWLLFRLVFSSGAVKLRSGDLAWRNLTALQFHYETQPLPTWIGWYVHQLPAWFQKLSCVMMFGIELGIPFLIFFPRRIRLFASSVLIGFQLLILATGNYCFFNLLTIALCLLLIDDSIWSRLSSLNKPVGTMPDRRNWPKWILVPIAGIVLTVTSMEVTSLFTRRMRWPWPAVLVYETVYPFRSLNSYGLFAVMTTSRSEIMIEGSNDGVNWLAYEFKWKPGDLKKRPGFIAPYQPRLDWQMWFAALGTYRENPWFVSLIKRLLEGSPDVLALFKRNPFPVSPPRYIRAALYDYRFTGLETRYQEGIWWRSQRVGLYLPSLSVKG